VVVAEVDQDSASTFEGVIKGLGDEVLSAQQIGYGTICVARNCRTCRS